MLGWLAVEKIRDGYATSLGASSGLVAGLVAITPAAGALTPMTSILLGAGGGILSCFRVSLKYRFNYDDSLDVVGIHLVAAVWGTIGLAFFAQGNGVFTGGGADGWKLFAVQTVVAIAAMFFSGVLTYLIAIVVKHTMGWRVTREQEFAGVDYSVHRETGYDFGGPGLRPDGIPAGNNLAAEATANQ